MEDRARPWPGGPSGADDSAPGAPAPFDPDGLIARLPDRFQTAGERLVRKLPRPGRPHAESSATAPDSEPWYHGLGAEEAWAVAETFRRAPGESASPEYHAALDRALLDAALAAETRTAAAHRRMLEDVSHDIRSPLNSILFLADALRSERSGPLSEVQGRQVGILYTAAVTLVGLVNDLIDFARLDSRERVRVAESSFSVESALGDVRNLLGPIVDLRGVTLQVDIETDGLRSGDPQLLSRVLLNLLSNAVQAVDEGGRVSVRVDETPRGDLGVEISDDRVDTDEGHLRSLIDSAVAGRLPGETRGWTHGLGLSICARLVQAAEGRLQVGSQPGEGTVFRLELPFRRL
jgi:signal transduction histidine kinase